MNKIFLALIFLIVTFKSNAQAPLLFKYQTVVRDNSGNIIANQNVSFKISILENSINGNSIYEETHNATTNQFGLVNLNIGNGLNSLGELSNIKWGNSSHFVKIEFDALGGSNYIFMGTSQLLSVPYALYAEKSGDIDKTNFVLTGTKNIRILRGQADSSTILSCLKISGIDTNANITISGILPNGVTSSISNTNPNFNTLVNVIFSTSTNSQHGIYPLQYNVTSGGVSKFYPFNLQIDTLPCTNLIASIYTCSDICNTFPSQTQTYSSNITSTANANQFVVTNFANLGSSATVNLFIDCYNNTATIPSQSIPGGYTVSGGGYFSTLGTSITVNMNYTITSATTTIACSGTWSN